MRKMENGVIVMFVSDLSACAGIVNANETLSSSQAVMLPPVAATIRALTAREGSAV